ncbi:ComF family protein [Marinobacter confluentis]|uniref:ComF family protein n=1 Tax=Marinobacter confluentis TaxID=1697557 RepID=UPI001CD9850B|nr:ComF family protein [Marinobacter confluentis]
MACLEPAASFGLCTGCHDELPWNRWQCRQCRQCGLPLAFPDEGLSCGECLQNPPPFSRVIVPWHYRFPVDRMIHRYKDSGQRAFAKPLLKGLERHLSELLTQQPDQRPDLLVPTPMHPARRRARGFNQASDIAEHLSRALDLSWSACISTRTRQTRTQRGLDRHARLNNLAGIFRIVKTPPPRVAIVDDVVTTGATVRLFTKALKQAGAQEVQVWALARTPG